MRILYRDYLDQVEKDFGIRPTHVEISNLLGGKPNANSLSNRLFNNGYLKQQERMILDAHYYNKEMDANLIKTNENLINVICASSHANFINVPYWEGIDEETTNRIKDDGVPFLPLGLDYITNNLRCNPDNLRIISMLGDDMDGGTYPIRNKDLLLIDISRNQPYESGVFFVTTHGGTRQYVRRIFERMTDSSRYYTTIDNEIYKKEIEKFWTVEKWEEADVQVVGRVIKNMSYTIWWKSLLMI